MPATTPATRWRVFGWLGSPNDSALRQAIGRAPMVKTSRKMPPTPVAAPWYGSIKLGWLWLSILNTTACPSPMSMTPAFSPGPWITHGAFVGNPRRWMRDDLYEQCSFHIAEKIPSSVKVGVRPSNLRMRSYSSGLRPCDATSSGVIGGSLRRVMLTGGPALEACSLSPRAGRGSGGGAMTQKRNPSPGTLRVPTSPRERGEVKDRGTTAGKDDSRRPLQMRDEPCEQPAP